MTKPKPPEFLTPSVLTRAATQLASTAAALSSEYWRSHAMLSRQDAGHPAKQMDNAARLGELAAAILRIHAATAQIEIARTGMQDLRPYIQPVAEPAKVPPTND